MRVLFATPECAPLTKTGGLGDVSGALPPALRALGLEVRVLVPGYRGVLAATGRAREVAAIRELGCEARLLEAGDLLVLDCPALYLREGDPYLDAQGRDWPDNALRFGLFSRVAALLGSARSPLPWRPQVVHGQDWPAGLAPAYLRFEAGARAATLQTVHNLAFQGNFDPGWLGRLGLPAEAYGIEGVEFYGKLSFLKGGLAYADALSTVSPTYAREIQTEAFGCGLDGLLRRRSGALSGILNGIDTRVWDPARDARIAARYGPESLEKKRLNKAALQKALGLEARADVPLLGMVSRLTHQKGIDLVAACADAIAALPAQLAVLGAGSRDMEAALAAAAARHPGALAVRIGFDEDLAHAIEAGADLFLMPSRFEPCGLNQMYSQRYGTPPLAHATGGLADTIVDGETGFLFAPAEAGALLAALGRAAALWRDAGRWRALQRAGMARDFGWGVSARRYAELYARLAADRPAAVP